MQGDTFYLYKDGKFYRSRDGGAHWTQTPANLPRPDDKWKGPQTVRATPGMKGEVWISLDKKGLFRSSDGGDSFTKVPNVERAYLMAFGKNAPGQSNPALYVLGSINGVWAFFRSDDLGQSWLHISDETNTINKEPNTLAADRQVFGRIYVGTGGRGIFYGEPQETSQTYPASRTALNAASRRRP